MAMKEALTDKYLLCVFICMQAYLKFVFHTADNRKKIHPHLTDKSYAIDLHMLEGPLLFLTSALLPVLSHTPMLKIGKHDISCDIPYWSQIRRMKRQTQKTESKILKQSMH